MTLCWDVKRIVNDRRHRISLHKTGIRNLTRIINANAAKSCQDAIFIEPFLNIMHWAAIIFAILTPLLRYFHRQRHFNHFGHHTHDRNDPTSRKLPGRQPQ